MKNVESLNRRDFLKTSVLASTTLAASALPLTSNADITKPPRDVFDGLKMGITTYTYHKQSLDQAIQFTKEAGVKYISLKDVHLPLNSTAEQCKTARAKIHEAGLTLLGGGVIYIKSTKEDEVRKVFDYAKNAGMGTIICSPDPASLDVVEKLAKEYDIRIAIHNHGPTDDKYPSPFDVWKLVKDRDSRMGLCIDVGHTVRIKVDPIDAIQKCASRLYDFHLKDVNEATPAGHGIEVGRGVIDIVAVLKTLKSIDYPHHVALEYEVDADHPQPGVLESYAYIRGVLASI